MVHSNKVLTVSYGTFSCTLEGFEDSFDTMKAIAEYFRDLAADDRYFGAEPPQPDAEMLARIAQREIARQVEARREGTGIVLRAAAAQQVADPVAPAAPVTPAAQPEAQAEAGTTEVQNTTSLAEATLAEAEALVAEVPAEADSETTFTPEAPEYSAPVEDTVDAFPVEDTVVDEAVDEAAAALDTAQPTDLAEETPAPAATLLDDASGVTEDAVAAFMASATPSAQQDDDLIEDEIAPEAAVETVADGEDYDEDITGFSDPEVEPPVSVAEIVEEDDTADSVAETPEDEAQDADEDEPASVMPQAALAAAAVATPLVADSIAAKLQRIRAVVSRNIEDAAPDADEPAQPVAEEALFDDLDAEPAAETDVAESGDETPNILLTEDASPEVTPEAEAPAPRRRRARGARLRRGMLEHLDPESVDTAAPELSPELAPELAPVAEDMAEDVAEDLVATDVLADAGDEIAEEVAPLADLSLEAAVADVMGTAEPDIAEPAPAIAEDVIAEAESADEEFAAEELAEAPQIDPVEKIARELPPSTLAPEDEAELLRELAEVEAELRGDHLDIDDDAEAYDVDDEDEDEDAPVAELDDFEDDIEDGALQDEVHSLVADAPLAAAESDRFEDEDENGDEDWNQSDDLPQRAASLAPGMEIEPEEELEPAPDFPPEPAPEPAPEQRSDLSRLMAVAEDRLGAAEAATTRETYSHLRAAVVATQAERSAGGNTDALPDAEAYRDDLAQVVHPRRPTLTGARRSRRSDRETQKPAPLKLVAEQRVDDVATARPGPVRPRRIAAAPIDTQRPTTTPEEGFAGFAAEVGATELPDLLEAAASYMQFVEGREQFTRPQLIHKAREAAMDEFNREDGLRSFGQLLREGKIVKSDPGRFVASGDIGFQPASRAAG